MDLQELGIVATPKGVSESADQLDRLAGSSTRADDAVTKFNSKAGETGNATSSMNGYLDEGVAVFARMGPVILGAVAALAAFVGGALALENFVSATAEAEAGQAQLAAALASTRGVSGQTLDSLNAYAEKLQSLTTYEDDAINKSQALLLTFTKIGGEVFPQATDAIADLAARMGGDLQGATIQIGKALNDPVKGLTSLSRAGVQFTDTQKELIENFVKQGEIVKAQTVILKELETQFGGSAEAARNNLGGAITALQNAFGNLFEVSGPVVEQLRQAIEALITSMSDPAFKDFANTIGTVLLTGLKLAVDAFALLADGISEFWGYAGPTIKEFGSLMYDLGAIVIPAIGNAIQTIWEIAEPIIQYFLEGWKQVYDVIAQIIGLQDQVQTPTTPTATEAAPVVPSPVAAADAAATMNKGITTAATTAANTMNKGVTTAGTDAAKASVDAAAEASKIGSASLANSFGEGANAVGTAVSSGGDTASAAIEAAGNVMAAKFEGTGRNIYDLWNNWGDSFINSFGVSIGELLIDFQRAQTAQLEAQAELLEAQARLTNEQYKFLRDNGAMPGTEGSGSGGSSGGGGDTTTGSLSFDMGGGNGGGGGRRKNRDDYNVGNFGSDLDKGTDKDKGKKWQPLDERGNVSLKIVNQQDPREQLDNLRSARGERTIKNMIGNNRRQVRAILGIGD